MSDHVKINDPKETLEIQNVVASTAIGQELNLESVAMDLEGADFDREKFPGVVYRVQDPRAAALISDQERSFVPVRNCSRRSRST